MIPRIRLGSDELCAPAYHLLVGHLIEKCLSQPARPALYGALSRRYINPGPLKDGPEVERALDFK